MKQTFSSLISRWKIPLQNLRNSIEDIYRLMLKQNILISRDVKISVNKPTGDVCPTNVCLENNLLLFSTLMTMCADDVNVSHFEGRCSSFLSCYSFPLSLRVNFFVGSYYCKTATNMDNKNGRRKEHYVCFLVWLALFKINSFILQNFLL